MKRAEYIGTLEVLLKVLPEVERRDILYDYEEHFTIAMESGKSEEEVCEALGQPKAIAKELIANHYIGKAKEHISTVNVVRATLATIGMGFFNLLIVAGPLLAAMGVLVALYAAALALIISPLALVGEYMYNGLRAGIGPIFWVMTTCSLGLLLGVGMICLTKRLYRLFLKYLQLNVRIIRGK
ncbi:HAAS signaling domain-containing protein [Brevibacillus sp. B_LB10_24]|uniref:HAAS signaling domain-containing protein n=1 Tax=Brevibacillus sp. B_LB10_24 TaxID=3380645 RepID=UPI0038B9B095